MPSIRIISSLAEQIGMGSVAANEVSSSIGHKESLRARRHSREVLAA